MFEALRGLRDAVAPESGNLGNNQNDEGNEQQRQPNAEELWTLYQARDEIVLEMTKGASFSSKDAFVDWYNATEYQKDADLVEKHASAVLRQSAAIDSAVADLPGMHRTRDEQMAYIEQLIHDNTQAASELETAYATALERRNQCRQFVQDNTSRALGIDEE